MQKTPFARPFLKWAGGKSQLLDQFNALLPLPLSQGLITRYVEPFVGGGAMFFHLKAHYPLKDWVLNDINPQLHQTWLCIQQACEPLIDVLSELSDQYKGLSAEDQSHFYYHQRALFNQALQTPTTPYDIQQSARLIFLNKTGFNGLYRVNRDGLFNVPFGRSLNPTVCDVKNLRLVARALQNVTLLCHGYAQCDAWITPDSFVYLDPPYRPLNQTARFTHYAAAGFNDADQLALARFYQQQHAKGAALMLSNTDPNSTSQNDAFFDAAYTGFTLNTVSASRSINAVASKRGRIAELVITNYTQAGFNTRSAATS